MPTVIIGLPKELEKDTLYIYQEPKKIKSDDSKSLDESKTKSFSNILKVQYINDKGNIKNKILDKFLGENELSRIEKDIEAKKNTVSDEIIKNSIIVNCSKINLKEIQASINMSKRISTQIDHIRTQASEKIIPEDIDKKLNTLLYLNVDLNYHRRIIEERMGRLKELKENKYLIKFRTIIPKMNSSHREVITYEGFEKGLEKLILSAMLDLKKKCREVSIFLAENKELNFTKKTHGVKLIDKPLDDKEEKSIRLTRK
jgi:hypothetical protein